MKGYKEMTDTDRCAALLENIHQVMKAEDLLNGKNIFCDLVPVPREISSDCGMAVVVNRVDIETLEELLSSGGIKIQALFQYDEGEYVKIYDRRGDASD